MHLERFELELIVVGMMLAKPESALKVSKNWFVNNTLSCIADQIQKNNGHETLIHTLRTSGCDVKENSIAGCICALLERMQRNAIRHRVNEIANEVLGVTVLENDRASNEAKDRFAQELERMLQEYRPLRGMDK